MKTIFFTAAIFISFSLKAQVTITKNSLGLGNVENTADSLKPISKPTAAALKVNTDNINFVYKLVNGLKTLPPDSVRDVLNTIQLRLNTAIDAIAKMQNDSFTVRVYGRVDSVAVIK